MRTLQVSSSRSRCRWNRHRPIAALPPFQRTSQGSDRFAPADLPRGQTLADGDRHVGGGLRHVAVVVVHRFGLAGFERQVSEGRSMNDSGGCSRQSCADPCPATPTYRRDCGLQPQAETAAAGSAPEKRCKLWYPPGRSKWAGRLRLTVKRVITNENVTSTVCACSKRSCNKLRSFDSSSTTK